MRREPEGVREAVVLGQPVRLERRMRGLDHLDRAARVDLVAGQIGEVGEDRLVHEAGAAGPVVLGPGLGQHRHEREVGVLRRPLLRQLRQVQVLPRAHAPVQDDPALHPDVERVLDHALHRREAGRARHEDDRLRGVLAQEERAQRPLEADRVADLHRGEDVRRELAAGDQPDLQLDLAVHVRRGREREAPFLAVAALAGQQDVDVLAGIEADRLAVDLELDDHHVVARLLHRGHLRGVDARRGDRPAAPAARIRARCRRAAPRCTRAPCPRRARRRTAPTPGTAPARRGRRAPCTCTGRSRRCGTRTETRCPSRSAASRIVSPGRAGMIRLSGRTIRCTSSFAVRFGGSQGSSTSSSVSAPTSPHIAPGDHA